MPETRRVALTLEVDTAAPLRTLQRAGCFSMVVGSGARLKSLHAVVVRQAQANVIQPAAPTRKPTPKARARKARRRR